MYINDKDISSFNLRTILCFHSYQSQNRKFGPKLCVAKVDCFVSECLFTNTTSYICVNMPPVRVSMYWPLATRDAEQIRMSKQTDTAVIRLTISREFDDNSSDIYIYRHTSNHVLINKSRIFLWNWSYLCVILLVLVIKRYKTDTSILSRGSYWRQSQWRVIFPEKRNS